jgi:hypothetical protein
MSDDIRSLALEHQAFYEVLPYYLVLDESRGRSPAATRRVHAGYDVDVIGTRTDATQPILPPPDKYALACSELQRMATQVSRDLAASCSVEVIAFPATAVVDPKAQGRVGGLLRVRIAHCGALDEPAGLPERRALEAVEEQLTRFGIARR